MSSIEPANALTLVRKYDKSYYSGNSDWIPRRGEIEVVFSEAFSAPGSLRSLDVELKSGPPALYRYFPFSVYVYVDDRAAAILEFSAPHETQSITIEVPASRCRLTFVSELAFPPRPGQPEQRELALLLSALRVGEIRACKSAGAVVAPIDDRFSHQRVGVVDALPEPIFVVGPYRSGTSILTWAVGQHPNIWPLPETLWLPWIGAGATAGYWIGTQPPRNYFSLCDVSEEEYLAHLGCCIDDFIQKTTRRRVERSAYERAHQIKKENSGNQADGFQFARTLFSPKRRWVDGTPENAGHMALIHRLYPAAKFICTVRNPIDVIISMQHFEQAGGNSSPIEEAADMWRRQTEATVLAGRAFGSDVVRFVSYEDLIKSPASAINEIFDFLGEPRFEKASEVYRNRINSSSVSQDQRDSVRPRVEKFVQSSQLLQLHDEALRMVDASWAPDAQAKSEIDQRQKTFVMHALKGALPDVAITAP